MPLPTARTALGGILCSTLALTSCAYAGRLGEYEFQDRRVAVVLVAPPRPEVFTGNVFFPATRGGLAGAIVAVGGEILREREASRLRERLDEANRNVDVGGLLGDRSLEHAARLLRAQAVERVQDADFEVEIQIEEYGIEADSWDAQARFYLEAEIRLLDATDGSEVWKAGVSESDAVNSAAVGLDSRLSGIVTAAAMSSLSVTEIEGALTGLAQYCADRMADKLRGGLEKARG